MKKIIKSTLIYLIASVFVIGWSFIDCFAEIPVYRLYNTVLKVHLYSTDANEKAVLEANPDWNYEGVVWNGYESGVGQNPIYRLYSQMLGKHLFTMDENEKNVLDAGDVWQFESISWYANATPMDGDIPIYRLYSDILKQHLYTADENEKNTLDGNGVWVYEGIAFYTSPSTDTSPPQSVCSGGSLYDDFSGTELDPNRWWWWEGNSEYVREVSDGRLNMHVKGDGQRSTVTVAMPQRYYVEAKVMIKSDSQILTGAQGVARIGSYYYNDTYGPGSGLDYNEDEGGVWVDNRLILNDDGTLRARAMAWRSNDADGFDGETLFMENFQSVINFDTYYRISIEFTGSELIFKCNDEILRYTITSPIYDSADPTIYLQSRVYADPGEWGHIKAAFDDVCVQ